MVDWPFVWTDDIVGGDPPQAAEPPAAGAAADPGAPAGARAPSERVSPEPPASSTTGSTTTAEAAKAKIEAMYADPNHPLHRGDLKAIDEVLALTRLAHPDADAPAPELPPRELTATDLPHFNVPADMAPEDTRALQELVAHSGVDPAVVQAAIHRVDGLLAHPLPDASEAADAQAEREGVEAIAEARRRLGDRWDEVREQVHHAKLMLKEVRPELYERLVTDPRTTNDFQLYMHLAALGKQSRNFFASKYGTSRAPRA